MFRLWIGERSGHIYYLFDRFIGVFDTSEQYPSREIIEEFYLFGGRTVELIAEVEVQSAVTRAVHCCYVHRLWLLAAAVPSALEADTLQAVDYTVYRAGLICEIDAVVAAAGLEAEVLTLLYPRKL